MELKGEKMKNEFLQVGVITSPHGLAGEVKVFPSTDDPARFKKLKKVLLGEETKVLEISQVRFVKNMVILRFKDHPKIESVMGYRGKALFVSREEALPLEENQYYIPDLVGMEVVGEEGGFLGTLTEVLQTGANDVYVVKKEDGKEILIPAIRSCILQVSTEENRMVVHLLEGL